MRFHNRCGSRVSTRNVTPGYRYVCPRCDEDLDRFETFERRLSGATLRDYLVAFGSIPSWFVVFHYLRNHAEASTLGYPVAGYLPVIGATGLTLVLVLLYVALRIPRD